MIVFNFQAIIVLVIALIIIWPLSYLFPVLGEFGYPHPWLMVTIVAAFCEKWGLRGRVFWVPVWILSLLLMFTFIGDHYNRADFYVLIACLFAGLLAYIFLQNHLDKKRWERAKISLMELRTKSFSKDDISSWGKLVKSVFIPFYIKPVKSGIVENLTKWYYRHFYLKWLSKKEVNKHYSDLIDLLKNTLEEREFNRFVAPLEAQIKNLNAHKKATIDPYMLENLYKLLFFKLEAKQPDS